LFRSMWVLPVVHQTTIKRKKRVHEPWIRRMTMPPYIPGKVALEATRTDHIGVREMFESPNTRIVAHAFSY